MAEKVYWNPGPFEENFSQMAEFAKKNEKASWSELYAWSVENFREFWRNYLSDSGILYQGDPEEVFRPSAQGTFYGGSWFEKLQLNYAQNLMHGMCEKPLVVHDEKDSKTYSKLELSEAVRKVQSLLREKGIKKGDVVAAVLPNRGEAIFSMLAATALGATWASCSPEFGVKGILDRFEQIQPKFLFLCKEYSYNLKTFSMQEKNEELLEKLSSVEASIVVGSTEFSQLLDSDRSRELEFVACDFMHPLYILFSSGTTGAPKCIVHSLGGTLLQHYKELKLHSDLRPGENFGFFTTTGWMMWNWMVSALGLGVRVHTYDGAALRQDNWTLWDWAREARLSAFGTSAKFIGVCRIKGLKAFDGDTPLRIVFSTGSALLPEDFDYFYAHEGAKDRIQLASISGGTDIVSCFMLGNPLKPVCRGEIQGAGLGMAIAAFDEKGKAQIGLQGELVCTKPFPSMPIYFFNDDNNERFESAYFKVFPGVWHHGDYVTIRENGGVVIHGRSDATLNPGGVRIGTAEIYRQVETQAGVLDSLVVGRSVDGDEEVVLFVKLGDNEILGDEMKLSLREKIKFGASPRHVPTHIVQCPDIPYTMSGKKVEIAVKKLLMGEEPKNIEALANPESLSFYRALRF